jgi:threonyl-tRNA synthetase
VDAAFLSQHKAKHLLAHVLVVAGARRWPQALLGESGETATGFYADFGLTEVPDEIERGLLAEEMARVLGNVRVFRDVQLTPREAREHFAGQPWKQQQVAVLAELGGRIGCYELDGFLDVCDCAIKSPRELRAVHPEKFLLTGAEPVAWRDRTTVRRLVRITGEIFPAPPPCECCPPAGTG